MKRTSYHTTFRTIILLASISVFGSCLKKENELKLQDCLVYYPDIILTARDVVTEHAYTEHDLKKYETIKIDTATGSILYVKYRFNIDDDKNNLHYTIGTMLSFERNEMATKSKLELWKTGYDAGMAGNKFKANNLDSIISFGKESNFAEYRIGDDLVGYHLVGRTENIVVSYAIVSNHVTHIDLVRLFRKKIEKIESI